MPASSENGFSLHIGDPATWSRNVPATPPLPREKSVKCWTDGHIASWVYFIQAANGFIKIGVAVRPEKRFSALQTGHAQKLHFLGAIPGDAADEREWHSRFLRFHVRGEWFRPEPELLAAIEAAIYNFLTPPPPLSVRRDPRGDTMTRAQERIAKGQCPRCGKEAAPYYLCPDHRFEGQIVRICNRATNAGGLSKEKRGGRIYYRWQSQEGWDAVKWRPEAKEGDERLAPRLNGKRVNIEQTIINIMRHIGRPVTIEELTIAWGKLRAKRDAPLAADLSRIIIAEDRRKAKAAKRLRNTSASTAPTNTVASPDQPNVPLAATSLSDGWNYDKFALNI